MKNKKSSRKYLTLAYICIKYLFYALASYDPQDMEQILLAAQSASTSSFLQPSSMILITGRVKRERLVTLTKNQQYVADEAEFLVFCADLQRHYHIVPDSQLGFTELTLISAIDTAMMGQNTLLAAETLGFGVCLLARFILSPMKCANYWPYFNIYFPYLAYV